MNSGGRCREWVFSRWGAAEWSVGGGGRGREWKVSGLASRKLASACAVSAGQNQIASGEDEWAVRDGVRKYKEQLSRNCEVKERREKRPSCRRSWGTRVFRTYLFFFEKKYSSESSCISHMESLPFRTMRKVMPGNSRCLEECGKKPWVN